MSISWQELYLYGMHVSEYFQASHNNHIPGRERKLLLHRKELKQLQRKVKERGYTIVPLKLFATERNLIKAEIALVQGKTSLTNARLSNKKMLKGKGPSKKRIEYLSQLSATLQHRNKRKGIKYFSLPCLQVLLF